MEKIRILAIAPYEGLKKIINQIGKERDDAEITAYQADLELGAQLVSQIDEADYDVIISRGGTAMLIREVTELPVLDITLSHYDVLNGIMLAEKYSGTFAVMAFPSISNFAKVLCDILQYDIPVVTIHSTAEAAPRIRQLKDQGFSMVLGDTISYNEAKKAGLNTMLITCSRESVIATIEDAVNFYRYYKKMQKQNQLYSIATCLSGGGVAIYKGDALVFINAQKNKDLLLKTLRKMLPFVASRGSYVLIEKVGRSNMKFSGFLKKVNGEAHTFFLIEKQSAVEPHVIPGVTTLLKDDVSNNFFSLNYSSTSCGDVSKYIEEYSKSTLPLVIIGEVGTGKEETAKVVYQSSQYSHSPCYCIDFLVLDGKEITFLTENPDSCLMDNGNVIFFNNLHNLEDDKLHQLTAFIENTNLHRRNKLILSYTCDAASTAARNPALSAIVSTLGCLTIYLPALRERTEDIPDLVNIYINEINASLGLTLLGCDSKGLELLKDFSWENNLDQLKRVLNELAAVTKTPYINSGDVIAALGREKRKLSPEDITVPMLNLHQPLEKITQDIVMAVLAQENMNQTATAKRLGISRTTLWRILK